MINYIIKTGDWFVSIENSIRYDRIYIPINKINIPLSNYNLIFPHGIWTPIVKISNI